MEFLIALLIQYPILLFSLCVHEAAHAAMANRCGDPSARLMGRLTLDPRKHIDPIGTVFLPILMMLPISGALGGMIFGWAKPVPFNPRNLHNMRTGPVWIALAGPGSNFLLTVGAALAMRILAVSLGFFDDSNVLKLLILVCMHLAVLNLSLMLFNMIPVPPLDGHYLLGYFLPPEGQRRLEQIGPMGILIAILLVQNLGILDGPFHLMMNLINFIAFQGTPLATKMH